MRRAGEGGSGSNHLHAPHAAGRLGWQARLARSSQVHYFMHTPWQIRDADGAAYNTKKAWLEVGGTGGGL